MLKNCFAICSLRNTDQIFHSCRTKLKNHEYETLDQLEADLNLMFENAKRYNVPNSAIYKRVLKMQQVMQVCGVEQSKGYNFTCEFISLMNTFSKIIFN